MASMNRLLILFVAIAWLVVSGCSSDVNTIDGDTTDGDSPDGDLVDGDTDLDLDGDTTDSDDESPDGDKEADGDAIDGDTTDGDTSEEDGDGLEGGDEESLESEMERETDIEREHDSHEDSETVEVPPECDPNPCEELHRNICVMDDSLQGYHCECNEGYVVDNEACILDVVTTCPQDTSCQSGYCLPADLSQEQCVSTADCTADNPASPATCNAAAAGGICLGCGIDNDCPGITECTQFGACADTCTDNSDCPYGRCAQGIGFCAQKQCTSNADCANNTVCIDDDGDNQGLCSRIPCTSTK